MKFVMIDVKCTVGCLLKGRLPADTVKMKLKWPASPPSLVPLNESGVLNFYVDTLTQRNHVIDPVTGQTPIEQRNTFIADLKARGFTQKTKLFMCLIKD